MLRELVLEDSPSMRYQSTYYVYICQFLLAVGVKRIRIPTFLQLHGKIQVRPSLVAIFEHRHLEDQLVNILKVLIATPLLNC